MPPTHVGDIMSKTTPTMKKYLRCKFILFASLTASGLASSDTRMLRRSVPNAQPKNSRHRHHPHHLKDVRCQLHHKETFGEEEGYSEKQWSCKLSPEESKRVGVEYVDILDSRHILHETSDWPKIVSDETFLELSEAIIDRDSKMRIPHDAVATVKSMVHVRRRNRPA